MATLNQNNTNKRGMSEREASDYLGIPMNSLRQSRCDGPRPGRIPPPPYCKIGKRVLYLRDDLDLFLEQHRIN